MPQINVTRSSMPLYEEYCEEINVPLKKIGMLILLSIVLAVGFYIMIIIAIGYALSPMEVEQSVNTSSLVAVDAMKIVFNSQAMAKILILGGICGIVTSWNSFVIGGSRAIYSMAQAHMIPEFLGKIDPKTKTPKNAIILVGLLSVIAPFFGRKTLVWVADAASFACCFAYCMVALSFLRLRKTHSKMSRPYKVKHHRIVGLFASVISGFMLFMYIIPKFGATLLFQEWIIVGSWTILGVLFSLFCKKKYGKNFGKINVQYTIDKE